ncbi:hypothetical protein [Kaistia granuli]|uniref:hypothetical protein n=1 Tax=Kaistia granuli TaxID=363259 RepID=UPI00035C9637|nr:hypothetical protein [Kaistia granuli]
MEELYSGRSYQVQAALADDGPVVVCFDPWSNVLDPDRPPFGLRYFSTNNVNVVSIKSHGNHWYQHDEMDDVIERINQRLAGRQRVGYGSSMGAYGAINFSERLSLSRVLLFAPQFSPDMARFPWEQRWQADQTGLVCRYDVVSQIAPVAGGYIFYDPFNGNDRKHADLITARHPLTPVKMPFSGHHTLDWFGQNKTISRLIKLMVFDSGRECEAIRYRRLDRQNISTYWLNLSAHYLSKDKPALALQAAQRGTECERGDLMLARHTYATCLYASGAGSEAKRIWRSALDNPQEATRQRWLLGQSIFQQGWQELRGEFLEQNAPAPA